MPIPVFKTICSITIRIIEVLTTEISGLFQFGRHKPENRLGPGQPSFPGQGVRAGGVSLPPRPGNAGARRDGRDTFKPELWYEGCHPTCFPTAMVDARHVVAGQKAFRVSLAEARVRSRERFVKGPM